MQQRFNNTLNTKQTNKKIAPTSSTSMYLEKSFFRIRIRIIVKKAVKSMTKTKLLIIDNQ